jgi:RNA polymerase sigma factor (sigma-70 family)
MIFHNKKTRIAKETIVNPEELFSSNLALIEKIIKAKLFKYQIYGEDAEDCESIVNLKLIDNNYDKVAKFKGKSQFSAYIATVIINIILDNCIKSKEPIDNIYEPPVDNEDDFQDVITSVPTHTLTPEERMINQQVSVIQSNMFDIIINLAKDLSNKDRLMLKMIFEENIDVSKTARRLHKERHTVDRRVRAILNQFKEGILAAGININDAVDVIKYMTKQREEKKWLSGFSRDRVLCRINKLRDPRKH